MMTRTKSRITMALSVAVMSATGMLMLSSEAGAVSGRVKTACKADYKNFCPSYSPDSAAARSCMRSNGGAISRRCVDALVAAGEVSRAEVQRGRGNQ